MAMVDLEPVPSEEEVNAERSTISGGDLETHGRVDVLADMTRHDAERLHHLIAQPRALHRLGAGARRSSPTGQTYLPKFLKVMPVEYRRALAEIEREQMIQAAE